MKTKILPLLFTALLFAGCVGTPFKWSDARRIEVGMTTQQVESILGKPLTMASKEDREVWAWNYGTGLGNGGYFAVEIKDGKVVEVPKIPEKLK